MQATKFVVLDEFCCKGVVPILCGKPVRAGQVTLLGYPTSNLAYHP